MKRGLFLMIFLFCCFAGGLYSQEDTVTKVHQLKEVGVVVEKNSDKGQSVPVQVLPYEKLQTLPAVQLSDALKFMSGVVVKDYGGVGGLKTVAVRGFGAQHTAVAYDGVAASDCQTGQIDLSRFMLGNTESVSLNSGSDDYIFLPARLFASSSVLNIRTIRPVFKENKPVNFKAELAGGSFGYISPSLLLENRIAKRKSDGEPLVTSSVYANYLYSKGNYPFTIYYGGADDSTSTERRTNSDIRAVNAEANLYVHFNTHSELQLKGYFYYSNRGLPGPIIFYTTQSDNRLWDRNGFVQVSYFNFFNAKFAYQVNAKFNDAWQRYLDPHYLNEAGKLDNEYRQQEYYLSNAFLYKPHRMVSLALANDLFYNAMQANLPEFVEPGRFTSLTSLSLLFDSRHVDVRAGLLHTFVYNHVKRDEAAPNVNRFSPSASVVVRPWLSEHFYVRMFYKNIFRLPTFNDLYYRDVGSVDLKPENTHQVDLGVEYRKEFCAKKMKIFVSADGYYNRVDNKIIAIPVRNLFFWSMYNFGKVEIGGVDAQLSYTYQIIEPVAIELTANYSFQHAVDKTDKNSKIYNHQIPYTPRHSGSGVFTLRTKWIDVSYTLIVSGARYSLPQNNEANYMPGYTDHSLLLAHEFDLKKVKIGLKFEMLNLANKHYEIIRYYPMQGRSFRGRLTLTY